MDTSSPKYREQYLSSRQKTTEHGLDSCHNYFSIHENQYFLTQKEADKCIQRMEEEYYLLKIQQRSKHHYENIYMDTKAYAIYDQYENNEDHFIARTRSYDHEKVLYFQIKHTKDDKTTVYSFEHTDTSTNQLTPHMRDYYCGVYTGIVGHAPTELIFPSLSISYDRYIFYNKNSDERVDIDFNIRFKDMRNSENDEIVLQDLAVIESKSSKDATQMGDILKEFETKYCNTSLYILGLHALGQETSNKKIKKIYKQLKKMS